MLKSESIKAIAPAFLKAQKDMEAVTKDAKNPFFKSDYATLNAVVEACKEPLNSNGISIMQPVNGDYVETVLMHESGEFFACQTALVVKENNNPQALGSAISYARRYGLMSMLGLPAEDDDGEKAMARDSKPTVSQAATLPNDTATAAQMNAIAQIVKEMPLDERANVDVGSIRTKKQASDFIAQHSTRKGYQSY